VAGGLARRCRGEQARRLHQDEVGICVQRQTKPLTTSSLTLVSPRTHLHSTTDSRQPLTGEPGRLIMANRPLFVFLAQLIIIALAGSSIAQAQTAPQLKNAVSRKLQGGKAFDIALPLSGGSGIEC